jgi:hypothetical protein
VYIRFGWGNLRERDHLEDPGIDGILLKWVFKKWDGGTWIRLIWIGKGQVESNFECCNKPLDSIKFREFID